jgi:acyl-CoA synthetase (NDP forming)
VGDPVERFSEVVSNNDLVIYLGGGEVEIQEVQQIHGRNIPVFQSPERGIKAFSKLLDYYRNFEPFDMTPFYKGEIKGRELDLTQMVETFKKREGKVLSEHEAKGLLSAAGIPVTREFLVDTFEEAKLAAAEIGYPVVLKGSGVNITHKTELGLVKLDLRNEMDLNNAFVEFRSNSKVHFDKFLVQEMVQGDRELIIGLLKDPQFGPCVMFGIGGIYTETIKDVCFRLLPLDEKTAFQMINDIKMIDLLGNFRGQKEVDKKKLLNILLIISNIGMNLKNIKEIDINPLKINKMGEVKAVDALIIFEE